MAAIPARSSHHCISIQMNEQGRTPGRAGWRQRTPSFTLPISFDIPDDGQFDTHRVTTWEGGNAIMTPADQYMAGKLIVLRIADVTICSLETNNLYLKVVGICRVATDGVVWTAVLFSIQHQQSLVHLAWIASQLPPRLSGLPGSGPPRRTAPTC